MAGVLSLGVDRRLVVGALDSEAPVELVPLGALALCVDEHATDVVTVTKLVSCRVVSTVGITHGVEPPEGDEAG